MSDQIKIQIWLLEKLDALEKQITQLSLENKTLRYKLDQNEKRVDAIDRDVAQAHMRINDVEWNVGRNGR